MSLRQSTPNFVQRMYLAIEENNFNKFIQLHDESEEQTVTTQRVMSMCVNNVCMTSFVLTLFTFTFILLSFNATFD
jgi:hypothetical protein